MEQNKLSQAGDDFIEKHARRMLGEFATDALATLKSVLTRRKLVSSSELYNKLAYHIINATALNIAAVGVSFPDYGRIRDMRNVQHFRPLPNEIIQDQLVPWVAKQGLSKFKFIPGYSGQGKMPTEEQAIKRIAWGIGKGLHLGRSKYKTKAWYNKILWAKIHEVTEEINLEFSNYVKQEFKNALPKKI
ncbi:MAG: hypothetical protein HC831_26420 [Chloroflexia bacterium]|nr:hypothetical protein [Chloroflexia bacterium]